MASKPVPCPTAGCKNTKDSAAKTCVACYRALNRRAERPCVECGTPLSRYGTTGRCVRCEQKHRRLAAAAAKADPAAPSADAEENVLLRRAVERLERERRDLADRARMEDRLVEEVKEFIRAHPYRPVMGRYARKGGGDATEHEMMPLVSDAHYPEVVDPGAAMGISYNPDIAIRRMEYLRDTVVRYRDLRARAYPVGTLRVAVLGDMLSGNIHEELEVTNAFPMSEALVKLGYALHDLGAAWAEVFPKVVFYFLPGNHPRLTKKPRFKQHWDNWEWVLGSFVGALARDRFEVEVPKARVHVVEICGGRRIGLTHGDGVKSNSFAGIPFYGMRQRQEAIQSLLKSLDAPQLDMLCYGHFHQLVYLEGTSCDVLINGSIKGGDEFSIGTRYDAKAPVQALLTFHPKHGLTDLSRVNLGDVV